LLACQIKKDDGWRLFEMDVLIFLLFGFMYMSISKVYLLERARKDIQMEYNVGDVPTKFYILSILPMLYLGEK